MLAKIQGVFRLTRDIELKYTQDGKAIGRLGLVCSEKYGDKETVLFIDGTVFGKAAELINQYAGTKGTQIFLTGKLKTDQWEKDGQKYSKTVMIVEDFQFIDHKKDSERSQQSDPSNYNQPKHTDYQPRPQMPQATSGGLYDDMSEEIPF